MFAGGFTCADLIQPGLVQLQPNLEDFMDIDTMHGQFLSPAWIYFSCHEVKESPRYNDSNQTDCIIGFELFRAVRL